MFEKNYRLQTIIIGIHVSEISEMYTSSCPDKETQVMSGHVYNHWISNIIAEMLMYVRDPLHATVISTPGRLKLFEVLSLMNVPYSAIWDHEIKPFKLYFSY